MTPGPSPAREIVNAPKGHDSLKDYVDISIAKANLVQHIVGLIVTKAKGTSKI
jgi:hypothetical protein